MPPLKGPGVGRLKVDTFPRYSHLPLKHLDS